MSAIIGSIIHSLKFSELTIINHGALLYSSDGCIQDVIDFSQFSREDALANVENVVDYTGKFIIPGFVDAHCHAPQVQNLSQ